MGSGLAFCPKNEAPNKRAQKRARATGVVLGLFIASEKFWSVRSFRWPVLVRKNLRYVEPMPIPLLLPKNQGQSGIKKRFL